MTPNEEKAYDIRNLALDYAIRTTDITVSSDPKEVVERAQAYEKFLRGDSK